MKIRVPGSMISEPYYTYLGLPIHDRCINCEEIKKIIAAVTFDQRSGPICQDCFKSYQE